MRPAPPLHRLFAHLSLAAILLLALLPTFGRLQPAPDAGIRAALLEMCASHVPGRAIVSVSDLLEERTAPASPDARGDMGCAYCPLLTSLVLLVLWLIWGLRQAPRLRADVGRAAPAQRRPYPCGLGSRGPPVAF